jgi:hypothetical protein
MVALRLSKEALVKYLRVEATQGRVVGVPISTMATELDVSVSVVYKALKQAEEANLLIRYGPRHIIIRDLQCKRCKAHGGLRLCTFGSVRTTHTLCLRCIIQIDAWIQGIKG